MSAGRALRVAVVGASGALGTELIAVLERRRFPAADLVAVATDRSVGAEIEFDGDAYPVLTEIPRLSAIDLMFLCAPPGPSLDYAREALRSGVPCVDLSGALAAQPDVPVLVADLGVSPSELAKPLVATPAGAAIAVVLVLAPLEARLGLRRVVATTLEAVSGAGHLGIEALSRETLAIFNQEELPRPEIFERSVAFDCLPAVGEVEADGGTIHERDLVRDLRRMLGRPELAVAVTAVRVPTFAGDGISLAVEAERGVTLPEARALLSKAASVVLCDDDPRGPSTRDSVSQDAVRVGRLRADPSREGGLLLWISADAVSLAASNAVRLAEARFG